MPKLCYTTLKYVRYYYNVINLSSESCFLSVVCDENAEYKNETCVCKNGYSGNGIVCVKQQGKVLYTMIVPKA